MLFRYTVQCEFTGNDQDLIDRWLNWLLPGHIQDVIDCGAIAAEVIKLESDNPTFAINYTFPDQDAFVVYERDHAPRLRAEGKQLFPHEWGLVYSRSTAEVYGQMKAEP